MSLTTTPATDAGHATDRAVALLLLRLALGLDIAMHGITRLFIGGLGKFVASTAAQFQHTVLPAWQVRAFATSVPFLELGIGLLLLAGWGLRWSLMAGGLLMIVLEFGTELRGGWTVVSSQLLYSLLYSALLFCRACDVYSLDAWRGRLRR